MILGKLSVCICKGVIYFLLSFNVVLDDFWTWGNFFNGSGSCKLFVIDSSDCLRKDLDLIIYLIFAFSNYLFLSILLFCLTYVVKLMTLTLFFSTSWNKKYIWTFFYFKTTSINLILKLHCVYLWIYWEKTVVHFLLLVILLFASSVYFFFLIYNFLLY